MENFNDDATIIVDSESNAYLPIHMPWTPEQQSESVGQIGNYIFDKMDWEQKGHVDETNFTMYCKLAGVSDFRTVWRKIQNTGVGYMLREQWLNFFNAANHERILENAIHKMTVFALESEDYKRVRNCEGYDVTGMSSASSSPHPLSQTVARKRRSSQEKPPMYEVSKKMKLCNMRNPEYEGSEIILLKNQGDGTWKCYLIDFDETKDIKTRNIVPLEEESSAFRILNDTTFAQEITPGESVSDYGRQRKYSDEPNLGDAYSPFPLTASPESARIDPVEESGMSDSNLPTNLYALQCIHLGIGGDEIQDFEDGDEWVGLNGACAICFAQQSLSIRKGSSFQRSLSAHIRSCSGFYQLLSQKCEH